MDPNAPPPTINPGIRITSNDLSPVLQIVTWVLVVIVFLIVATRIAARFSIIKEFRPDDYLILPSLIFCIGQSIAVSLQNANGFGKHLSSLSAEQVATLQKSQYAAEILFIGTVFFAKISTAIFVKNLTPKKSEKLVVDGLNGVSLLWAVSSILASAFQCELPHPWQYIDGKCINRTAFWNYFGVMNIITDIALVVLPAFIIIQIKTTLQRRLQIISYFTFRLLTAAAIVVQLVYWNKASNSTDPTFDLWPYILITQVVQAASITATHLPQLRVFLVSVESGMLGADDLRRRNQIGVSGYTGPAERTAGTKTNISASTRSKPSSRFGLGKISSMFSAGNGSFNNSLALGGMSRNGSKGDQLEAHRFSAEASSISHIVSHKGDFGES